jgi:hypothetical protein
MIIKSAGPTRSEDQAIAAGTTCIPSLSLCTWEQISAEQYDVLLRLWKALALFCAMYTPLPNILTVMAQPEAPRLPLRLFSILQRHAAELFDCENRFYPQPEGLWIQRNNLAAKIETLVMENIQRFGKDSHRLRFHASHDEMRVAVREGLAEHIRNLPRTQACDIGAAEQDDLKRETAEEDDPTPSEIVECGTEQSGKQPGSARSAPVPAPQAVAQPSPETIVEQTSPRLVAEEGFAPRTTVTNCGKRGPKRDFETAMKVDEVTTRLAPEGNWRVHLDTVCEGLDEAQIRRPKPWKAKGHRTWYDCLISERPLVIKAIEHHLERARELKKTFS